MNGRIILSAMLASMLALGLAARGEVSILLPQGRTAFQDNEAIAISAVRAAGELEAGDLQLTLRGEDGSVAEFTFPVIGGQGPRTEHYHLDGRLIRPGNYTVQVAVDGEEVSQGIEVYSHLRRSPFRLVNWTRSTEPQEQRVQGELSMGYNLMYGIYAQDTNADFLRGGVDWMVCCGLGGGHQMGLRAQRDWSDPYVLGGGAQMASQWAHRARTRPNVPGVHFYDEPGLSWQVNERTGEVSPHQLPPQVRSYRSAFGEDPLWYNEVDPENPEHVQRWMEWGRWKLSFMDAAWKDFQHAVSKVDAGQKALTQSQYGWAAFTDGYYFNVTRSLPIASGHGGYSDWGNAFFHPSFTLEIARARDFARPASYLPTWYGHMTDDRYRMEQYMSFQTNIQGMQSPPDLDPGRFLDRAGGGIVETNHIMGRLGTIFMEMPVERPPVAALYSLSNLLYLQSQDRGQNYGWNMKHGLQLYHAYVAAKLLQMQFLFIVDEDVIDGTLAANHQAVLIAGVDHLDPPVIRALERFAAGGGLVILTGGSTVAIEGATNVDVVADLPQREELRAAQQANDHPTIGRLTNQHAWIEGSRPMAEALRPVLEEAGIGPIFRSSDERISATRQTDGDIEYLFAVSFINDPEGPRNNVIAGDTTIELESDGRAIYDAVRGGVDEAFEDGRAEVRFGPGQMRVWALTDRPIGGVKAARPQLTRDFTAEWPIQISLGATVLDEQGGLLSGAIPLRITVTDPLGEHRYDLYRSTRQGTMHLRLPLAANDPAGEWTVTITELLANTSDSATFDYRPAGTASAMSGATHRAVFLEADGDKAFQFARNHRRIYIVPGESEFNQPAAQRLVEALKPWNVEAEIIDVQSASQPRPVTEQEAWSWVGLDGHAFPRAGEDNPLTIVGVDLDRPVILLGNPEDHTLIRFLQQHHFLPFQITAQYPGPGRGYLAWTYNGIGRGLEAVILAAHDEQGMAEAVGSFYEAVAGLEPLTRWALPADSQIAPASQRIQPEPLTVAWTVNVPDRVLAVRRDGESIIVQSMDGTITQLDRDGHVGQQRVGQPGEVETEADAQVRQRAEGIESPDRVLKYAVALDGLVAAGYWGGTIRLADEQGQVRYAHQAPNDIGGMAVLGEMLVVGSSDGQVIALVRPEGQ